MDDAGKGLFYAAGANAQVYIGHADRFARVTRGNVRITVPEFVTITVTPLEAGDKILVTACGRCENTGMKFSRDRRTVGRNWGDAPVQIEAVEGQMALPDGHWTCRAIASDGTPRQEVPISYEGNRGVLKLSPAYGTMWYLLERK